MIVRFIYLTFFVITSLSVPLLAFAQDNTPLANGDKGWCTVLQELPAGEAQCGFGDPHAACTAQRDSYNPDREMLPTKLLSSGLAGCNWQIGMVSGFGPRPAVVNKHCNDGYEMVNGTCQEEIYNERCDECGDNSVNPKVGNPISVMSGAKIQFVSDFETADGRMQFSRRYHSRPFGAVNFFGEPRVGTGRNWLLSTQLEIRLHPFFSGNGLFELVTPYGASYIFSGENDGRIIDRKGAPMGAGITPWRIEMIDPWPGRGSFTSASRALKVIGPDGTEYIIQTEQLKFGVGDYRRGRVQSIVRQGGYTQNYTYDGRGLLTEITDSYNRIIHFEYKTITWQIVNNAGQIVEELKDGEGNLLSPTAFVIETASFPDGSTVSYEYDAANSFNTKWGIPERLIKATRQAGASGSETIETYHYEDERFPYHLTGITDASGVRYATYEYDGNGRATLSVHAGGADRTEVSYEKVDNLKLIRTVTNPLGKQTVYNLERNYFARKTLRLNGIDEIASGNTPAATTTYKYDPFSVNYGLFGIIDREGRETSYVRDHIGRITQETIAKGLPEESTTSTIWHEKYNSPLTVSEPGMTTGYDYDDVGNLLSITQTDTTGGASPRIWSFSYTADGLNIASVDGPLTGASDTQTFTYNGANITSITNEVGHVTQITSHSPIGLPQTLIDPNGVTLSLGYDYDNRLSSITQNVGGANQAVTTISYDAVDNVTKVTPPNGAFLSFTYDDARRLTHITNAAGETIEYGRNSMGGIASATISGSDQAISYQLSQTFDDLNRVITSVTAGPSSTSIDYDKEDNAVSAIDPRGGTWTQAFDGLNRVISETDPLGGVTDYDLECGPR